MSTSNNSKKLIVVLHMIRSGSQTMMDSVQHTLDQCQVAVDNNADGVSVISWGSRATDQELVDTAAEIKRRHPTLLVTINFLGNMVRDMSQVPDCADGIWTDEGVDSRGYQGRVLEAAQVRQSAKASWNGLWFAGFFHKGGRQEHVEDSMLQTLTDQFLALHPSVVPTFTGPGTGRAADMKLLPRIHRAIAGRKPMAIASGITVANVARYLPFIDYFFVATGIEQRDSHGHCRAGYLDPVQVNALAAAIHSYRPDIDALAPDDLSNTYLARHADKYLPWTCPSCTFNNESYPSVCEKCDQLNVNYAPVPLTASTAAAASAF